MKLTNFEIYSYHLPTTLGYHRNGFIVRLIDELGNEGAGEIAPLPGRSIETIDDALTALKQIRNRFLTGDLSPALFPPSVMFGMEMAVSSLLFPLKEPTAFKIYTNKVKLKDLQVQEAVDLCKNLKMPFRIDLNRMWDLKKTVEFCSHFKPSDFLYIEDPVSNFTDLEKFYDQTGFSYAVDEYLSYHPIERILSLKGLTHLVIKPTLHGGLTKCKTILEAAKDKTCVFSSTYETSIGLRHIAYIGSKLSPKESIGINTLHIFQETLSSFNPEHELIKKEPYPIAWNKLQKIL